MTVLVELYAGLASLTWHFMQLRPPVSRIGAKTGYAVALARELDLNVPPAAVLLVERDPLVANVLRVLTQPGDAALVANEVEALGSLPPRVAWERCRDSREDPAGTHTERAARWLLHAAGARGGIGGFKGTHKLRPSVDGFIPSRASLVQRLRAWRSPPFPVEVRCCAAEVVVPLPRATVYLDPPYDGRQSYGGGRVLPVETIALRWAAVGCVVGISEGRPLALPGWRSVDLTARRQGQYRRSLTRDACEWLTVWHPR